MCYLLAMNREYPDRPIVGVGAVIVQDGRVLLVRRAAEPLKGEWSIPGGMVEVGETVRAAAEREVEEETGLKVRAGVVLDVFDRIVPDEAGKPRFHYVLVDFFCDGASGEARAGSDAGALCWAAEDDIDTYRLSPPTLEVVRRGFAAMGAKK